MSKGKIFIIAEAGVNHNGNIAIAKRMIDVAASSGADAVKFQTFRASDIAVTSAPKADYQKRATGSMGSALGMLKHLELDEAAHKELVRHARKCKIVFMSTPFDAASVELLKRLGCAVFKVPSGEITNIPYLRMIGRSRKPVIMSTGMATMAEITKALDVLVKAGTPRKMITLMHCTTEYPASPEDANLAAMATMERSFKTRVGYSDHTAGITVTIAAAALGAKIIEKHFTLDKTMDGPDHKASLDPSELAAMVCAIRTVEQAIGDGIKRSRPSERKNIGAIRRSIVAKRSIKKGEVFSAENITTKRPGTGMSPLLWDKVVGNVARRDFKKEEFIIL